MPCCLPCRWREFIGYCCWGPLHRGDQPPRPMFCLDPRRHPITMKKIRLSWSQDHSVCELQDGISLLGSIFLPSSPALQCSFQKSCTFCQSHHLLFSSLRLCSCVNSSPTHSGLPLLEMSLGILPKPELTRQLSA